MTTRRLFMKQLLFSAWTLISCGWRGARDASSGTGDKRAHAAAGTITLLPAHGAIIQVECRFPRVEAAAPGAHPLQGALLCGIEAFNQVPRCVPLDKSGRLQKINAEEHLDFHRYRFTVDVDQALDLEGSSGVYFVHLVCRHLRSAVMVHRPNRPAIQ